MVKQVLRGLVMTALIAAGGQAGQGQTVTAVPKLDLNRFTGTWYEIALYPNKKEKKCASDAIVLFALGDKVNRFQLVNSCKLQDGHTDVRNADGRSANKTGDGQLKVIYQWPFSTKDWVLALDPEYTWALVGSPNRKMLWVLSRTAIMPPDALAAARTQATAQGFDVSKLVPMAQRH